MNALFVMVLFDDVAVDAVTLSGTRTSGQIKGPRDRTDEQPGYASAIGINLTFRRSPIRGQGSNRDSRFAVRSLIFRHSYNIILLQLGY